MKRDLNAIRRFLLAIEDIKINCETELQLRLMKEAGFIELTREGYRFLAECQDEQRWREVIFLAETIGGTSCSVIRELLQSIYFPTTKAKQKIPTPP